jgi:hypothetical protein
MGTRATGSTMTNIVTSAPVMNSTVMTTPFHAPDAAIVAICGRRRPQP